MRSHYDALLGHLANQQATNYQALVETACNISSFGICSVYKAGKVVEEVRIISGRGIISRRAITPLILICDHKVLTQSSPEVSIVVINLINAQNIKESYSKIF